MAHREAPSRRPSGVVCDDRPAFRRRLSLQLERAGVDVAGHADSFVPLLKLVLRTEPALAVVTLPLAGTSGMTAVKALKAAAPGCEVVVLSALGNLEVAAQEAGALAVLAEGDPLGLSDLLSALVRRSPPAQAGAPSDETWDADSGPAASAGSSTTKPSS